MTTKTNTCDLKKGVTYVLTYDFWPHGGKHVTLLRFVPAKEIWPKTKGNAALVKSNDGFEFFIHPAAWLFNSNTQ